MSSRRGFAASITMASHPRVVSTTRIRQPLAPQATLPTRLMGHILFQVALI